MTHKSKAESIYNVAHYLWKNRDMLSNIMATEEDAEGVAYYGMRDAGGKAFEVRAAIEIREFTSKRPKMGCAGPPSLALARISSPSLAFLWGKIYLGALYGWGVEISCKWKQK